MAPPATAAAPENADQLSLTKVLEQSEHIEELVKESAEELATVNAALKKEIAALKEQIAARDLSPGVENALAKSEAVGTKVEDASEKLTAVNQALEGEVRDRNLLDHRLAAVTEQGEAARHASFHDVLTGLPNRSLFNDRLTHGLAQAKRQRRSLAVMFLDLDKFKEINDTHGHEAGDIVLRTVATRLQESTRSEDTVARLGGDEFLFLLMGVGDPQVVAQIAMKLIAAVQAALDVRGRAFKLSLTVKASIGIALYPKDGATADTLIKSADQAMYRAKQQASGYAFAE